MPPMAGICKSMSVTSGWYLRNSSTASRPSTASATISISDWLPDERGDAFAQQGMVVH